MLDHDRQDMLREKRLATRKQPHATPVMECGHEANGTHLNGSKRPVCVICAGVRPGWDRMMDPQPDKPKGYRCSYCGRVSQQPVAFASINLDRDGYGNHYDGCRGWD